MNETITLNGKELDVANLTEDQIKMVNEAVAVQNLLRTEEFKLALLRNHSETLVKTLEDSLSAEDKDAQ